MDFALFGYKKRNMSGWGEFVFAGFVLLCAIVFLIIMKKDDDRFDERYGKGL